MNTRASPSHAESDVSRFTKDPLVDPCYWKKITIALLVNAITVPLAVALLFQFGFIDKPFSKTLSVFQENYYPFFWPWEKILNFVTEYAIRPALLEEFVYRGPVRFLLCFLPFFKKAWGNKLFLLFVWVSGIALNLHWAIQIHTVHKFMWIPVGIAGIAWLWLVIRTKSFWPSVFCHIMANLSIYFAIKGYQLFY